MLKKILFTFLILSTLAFANTTKNIKVEKQERTAKKEIIEAIERGEFYREGILYAATEEAEIFLESLDRGKGDLSKNILVLALPNVDVIEKNAERLSKRVKRIRILLLERKSAYPKLKNRSMEELKKKGIYKKLDKIKNLVVNEIIIDNETLDELTEKGKSMDKLTTAISQKLRQ